MPPEKSQTIFLHWLNVALHDARWRAFIRALLRESELPVIHLATERGPRKPLRDVQCLSRTLISEETKERSVIASID
jgi:uncharacterized membrane protein